MKSKFNAIYSVLSLSIMVLLSIFYHGDMLNNNPETKQFQHNNKEHEARVMIGAGQLGKKIGDNMKEKEKIKKECRNVNEICMQKEVSM
jgi:hypothetical protein